jgi:hypothetical protein
VPLSFVTKLGHRSFAVEARRCFSRVGQFIRPKVGEVGTPDEPRTLPGLPCQLLPPIRD